MALLVVFLAVAGLGLGLPSPATAAPQARDATEDAARETPAEAKPREQIPADGVLARRLGGASAETEPESEASVDGPAAVPMASSPTASPPGTSAAGTFLESNDPESPTAPASSASSGAVEEIAPRLSLGAYRDGVAAVVTDLEQGRPEAARRRARDLAGGVIEAPGETVLRPDPVLAELAATADDGAARRLLPRLRALRAALDGRGRAGPGDGLDSGVPAPDRELAARLDDERRARRLAPGGALPRPETGAAGALDAVAGVLEPVGAALGKVLRRVGEWLRDLFSRSDRTGPGPSGIDPTLLAVVLAVLVAVGLVALALGVRRRRSGAVVEVTEEPAAARVADADPLSRDVSGWERRAAELAATGRLREAIRAWYHAVLVTLYRGGLVSYRKGRTNWELVAAVPAPSPWREDFVEMTRLFEREWYGRDESGREALERSDRLARRLVERLERGRSPDPMERDGDSDHDAAGGEP